MFKRESETPQHLAFGHTVSMFKREMLQCLTLSRRNFGEADRLVTLFTLEKGLLRVLAKGVRRIPSRRGGHLEPFTLVQAELSRTADYYYLAGIDTQDYFSELHSSSAALTSAQATAWAAHQLFEYDVPYSGVYSVVRDAWALFPTLPPQRRKLLEAAVMALMLREAGLLPHLAQLGSFGVALSASGKRLWAEFSRRPRVALHADISDHDSRQLIQAVQHSLGGASIGFAVH